MPDIKDESFMLRENICKLRNSHLFETKNSLNSKLGLHDIYHACQLWQQLPDQIQQPSQQKKWNFPLRIFLVNVKKSAINIRFVHIIKENFIFCAILLFYQCLEQTNHYRRPFYSGRLDNTITSFNLLV